MKWIRPAEVEIPSGLLEAAGGNRLVAELLARRGIDQPDQARAFLDADCYQPSPPEALPGVDEGTAMLAEALREGRRIGVWGDFDVDGQTSTTLLVSALRQLGGDVIYHIPVRATESHGLNLPNLDRMLAQQIEVLLTCDTGISAHGEIAYCRERGVTVVVSDHHDLPEHLPEAEAVINSKLLPSEHPLSSLPGVGVAYKLVESLFEEFGRVGEEQQFLDLAALGIVADVALLHGDARYLLQRGLDVLRRNERLGLQVLFELAGIEPAFLTEEDIGFSIAPRLNALGRLGDANVIVEFLTTDREGSARVTANQLEGLNAQRKLLTSQVFQAARGEMDKAPELRLESSLVLVGERWPAGVVGIVANKMVERFGKPAVLLTMGEGGRLRGSARSVAGCDISKAIAACADLLDNFGGHPMAAGLALPAANLTRFRQRLSEAIQDQVGDELIEPELVIDQQMGVDQFSISLAEQISPLAPFGPGNPPVIFLTPELKLVSHSKMGKTGEHLRLIVEDREGNQQSVVWWGGAGQELPEGIFDLACSARVSTFKGERELMVELRDFQMVQPPEPETEGAELELLDIRKISDPGAQLDLLRESGESTAVWAEAEHKTAVGGKGRDELTPVEVLVVWTCPPSAGAIHEVINRACPRKVAVFALDPEMDQVESFLPRLAGLCRYAIAQRNGEAGIGQLAAATAQTEAAVRIGVGWLESRGYIVVDADQGDSLVLSEPGDGIPVASSPEAAMENLVYLLQESAAFRRMLKESSLAHLERLISV